MVRAPTIDENGMKKGAWSLEEDSKLRAYIQKYGPRRWRLIPRLAGLTRCGKSCRLRWLNYLHPDVKRGNFTEEENELIYELHEKYGNKWAAMAEKLPGRTDNEIKNHWHTNLKKKGKKQNLSFQEKPNEIIQDQNQNEKQEEITEAFCDYSSSDFGILESSSLSQETSSDSDNNLAFNSINSVVENQYGYGDFWTEPFISDFAMDSLSPLTAEYGIMSPLRMVTYDDYVDFLY